MVSRKTRVLILCKTYPSPSEKHVETSCVAGLEEGGNLIRLFPVPFRLIRDDQQFRKWQWITARIEKAGNDRRPESHKIFVDTIDCSEQPISTRAGWADRRAALGSVPMFEDFAALEQARQTDGITLGLLKPSSIISLDISPTESADWTEEEHKKLVQNERQSGLFDAADAQNLAKLRKVPFSFHYRYTCQDGAETRIYRHKIADWEAGALYWNCRSSHGDAWETPFRQKIETVLPAADLMFLMGTIHRFPDQWLIVSLLYPPKPAPPPAQQSFLLD
ncbi:hypothetical protein [Novosphingobium album (ex Liu et al. 2023)]|uniref:Uncharacterized protein n=1 Tax=Novosphingobium album (ex Liu et al. 2023) TaxID=3031130 RepID=A0ABT5WQ85_9SPHN|nr:hypothetical protein [Novosphingobium album (ex Liu et al. 2023)]MDE8652189.1 hypothetical protein [Novosphingobium album (ex Liu et al. 2023)]